MKDKSTQTMKKITTIIVSTLSLSFPLFGQFYTTGFTGGYDSAFFTELNTSGPSFALKNPDTDGSGGEFINYYTTTAPTGFERVFLDYVGTNPSEPSNTQDFAVSIDVSNFAGTTGGLTAPAGSFAQIGLNIADADLIDGFDLYQGASSFTGFATSDVIFFDGTNLGQPLDFSESVSLLAEFSATTQTFTFSFFSPNTGGVFSPFATLNINGTGTTSGTDFVADWAMASGDLFDISIYAASNVSIPDQAAGLGFLNADNFAITVVPEPSAYSALLGIFVLASVAAKRRRR